MAVTRHARRLAILIIGSVMLPVGVALLVLPGPGMVTILIGLIILAQEFTWAQRLLDRAVEHLASANSQLQGSLSGRIALALTGIGLIAGGIAIFIWISNYWVVGISLILGGVIGLATLHPRLHAWVEERAELGINDTDDV